MIPSFEYPAIVGILLIIYAYRHEQNIDKRRYEQEKARKQDIIHFCNLDGFTIQKIGVTEFNTYGDKGIQYKAYYHNTTERHTDTYCIWYIETNEGNKIIIDKEDIPNLLPEQIEYKILKTFKNRELKQLLIKTDVM